MNKMKNLNSKLGDKLAFGLSTMTMFYIITLMVLLPLIWQRPDTPIAWIQYLVQSLFQGSSLPILAYVAKLEGRKTETILNSTNNCVLEELKIVKDGQTLAQEERDSLKLILEENDRAYK